MSFKKVHLCLARPYEPLFSDKYLMWLAGTFARSGARIEAHREAVAAGPDELTLTNLRPVPGSENGAVLHVASPTDRVNRLMLALGRLYGRTGLFHSGGGNAPLRVLLNTARRPFRNRSVTPESPAEVSPGMNVPSGRRMVFRVNVDWDSRGLDILERWCERYAIRPTLAVAGSEILGREKRVRAVVERFGIDIASHSWTHHVVLSSYGERRQRMEIERNRKFLEDLFGRTVEGFVAPYIKYDRRTFALLAGSGHRWFIRSWSVHPLPLAGFDLTDLGVNLYFPKNWEESFSARLALSDLLPQLHLTDLPRLENTLEPVIAGLAGLGVRFLDCGEYHREIESGRSA